ncbi:MAG: DUF2914 domain-containing protein [Patescibacteria group bacterium]|jgi:hypothetical protein|nr:DUF2914 domain-containing protein [Patescibacteria group bacterium]
MKKFFVIKFNKYEKYLSPLALFSGFVVDNLTLRRIDLLIENLLIIVYLMIALLSIFVLNFSHAGYFKHRFLRKTDLVFTSLLQFSFGGLFSVFFVFYFRSASFITSWLSILFLASLLIGNEIFREKYRKLSFQLSIFFIALFSYSVILIPLIVRKINNYTFVLSGIFSLVIILIVIYLLNKFFPKRFYLNKKPVLISISSVYIIFNLLYFLNIIPPIPLSLKESELVHDLKRVNGLYEVEYEKSSFFQAGETSNTFSWQEGDIIYFYNSIFAPTNINIEIYHKWYFYDEEIKKWQLKSNLSYSLTGGRDSGYRGYSYKQSLGPGRWKIETTNKKGQVLGVKKFKIEEYLEPIELERDVW